VTDKLKNGVSGLKWTDIVGDAERQFDEKSTGRRINMLPPQHQRIHSNCCNDDQPSARSHRRAWGGLDGDAEQLSEKNATILLRQTQFDVALRC